MCEVKYVKVLNIAGLSICRGFRISSVTLSLPIFVNMTGFWICTGHNNGRVLNIPGFWICQISAYASITQGSKYDWIWLNNAWINWLFWLWQGSEYACSKFYRILNMSLILNMLRLGIWQGWEYARITQGAEYAWISPNMF